MSEKRTLIPISRPQHIIEWRMTLPAAISGLVIAASFTATMYFKGEKVAVEVQDLKAEIKDLRIEVKQGNAATSNASNILNLMQFRLETAESDIRVLKGAKK